MKSIFAALALAVLVTVPVGASVRADEEKIDEKTRIISSLLMPLSPDETTQLEALIKASEPYDSATAAYESAMRAVEEATPANKAALEKKAEAARTAFAAALEKSSLARDALTSFEESKRERLPAAISKAMKPGAISLGYEKLLSGPDNSPVVLHLSVVPKGGADGHTSEKTVPPPATPKTREELYENRGGSGISLGLNMVPSPFFVDVFEASTSQPGADYRLVNSVSFTDDSRVTRIKLEYLKPKLKQGPMLLLFYSTFRSLSTRVLTFPDGWRGRAAVSYLHGQFEFSQPDGRGIVAMEQRPGSLYRAKTVTDEEWIIRHVWDGSRFVQQPKVIIPQPYLIVAAKSKSRAGLKKLQSQLNPFPYQGEVYPTSKYPLLPQGSYILVLARFATKQEATQALSQWKSALPTGKAAAQYKLEVLRGS